MVCLCSGALLLAIGDELKIQVRITKKGERIKHSPWGAKVIAELLCSACKLVFFGQLHGFQGVDYPARSG